MNIVVVGSIMVDLVTRCPRYPTRGETVLADSFTVVAGGKGANQAVACAKMGARVDLIGAVGTDAFAELALRRLEQFGVGTRQVVRSTFLPTGTATIILDGASENTIFVSRGANNDLAPEHLDACAGVIAAADALLVQLETSLPAVERAMQIAHAAGRPILLDPAPAQPVPDHLLALADFLTPNSHEAEALTGIRPDSLDDARRVAEALHRRGARRVLVKRGAEGCLVSEEGRQEIIPGRRVKAVDTVGAGDCFAGALMVRWQETRDLPDACRFANAAAALKVQRPDAQAGIPTRDEVEAWLRSSTD